MRYLFFLGLLLVQLPSYTQSGTTLESLPLSYLEGASIADGEKLFRGNCGKCHQLCDQKLGPALSDVMYKRPFPWLVKFIQDSRELIASGDPYANHLFDAYNKMEMPLYPDLDENDIRNIMAYLKSASDKARKDTTVNSPAALSKLIEQARARSYEEELGTIDYYTMTTDLSVPIDEASALNGKALFKKHCNNCHELCESTIGPALTGITKRRPLPWLLSFINNPAEVVKTGDNYTNHLVSNYNFIMPQFSFLSEEQKLDILAYVRLETASEVSSSGVNSQFIAEEPLKPNNPSRAEQFREDQNQETESMMQTLFKIASILVIASLFAAMGFFIIRYFRK